MHDWIGLSQCKLSDFKYIDNRSIPIFKVYFTIASENQYNDLGHYETLWCELLHFWVCWNVCHFLDSKQQLQTYPTLFKIVLQLYGRIFKSLSTIYFIKIRLPDFLCNEYLIRMYRLLQNYTFEICTLSKIKNICYEYKFF